MEAEYPSDGDAWVLLRVPRADICILRYTLEAYEGLCVPTTLPGGEGLVLLSTSGSLLPELLLTLEGLGEEIPLVVLDQRCAKP